MTLVRSGTALLRQCRQRYSIRNTFKENLSRHAQGKMLAEKNPGKLYRYTRGRMDTETRWMKVPGLQRETVKGGLSPHQLSRKQESTPHYEIDQQGNRYMVNAESVGRERARRAAANAARRLDELNGKINTPWKPGDVNWSPSRSKAQRKQNRYYVMDDDDIDDLSKIESANTNNMETTPRRYRQPKTFKSALVTKPDSEFDCGTWLDNLEDNGILEPLERQFALAPEGRLWKFAENTKDYDSPLLQKLARQVEQKERLRRTAYLPEELKPAPPELVPTYLSKRESSQLEKQPLKTQSYWKKRAREAPDYFGSNEAQKKGSSHSMGVGNY
eukprot:TRINITY_DN30600_c0_g1_i1.p1 TRINITY_DN30600_c0_g1~~TRINITY_DN30600_c0_g1_i1.p1  ORF type:complete len:330 (+),score=60.70 TRINITY_DN30600_c0_g1_i1:54-1043(+)